MEWDSNLYNSKLEENMLVNTSDLNEELGQVEILFSDKTGTLTKNEMHFQMCSITGKTYKEEFGKLVPVRLDCDSIANDVEALTMSEYTVNRQYILLLII